MQPKLFTFRDLLKAEFPPDPFIIDEGLLPVNGIMVIGAPPKSYKSFILNSMAVSLATGGNIFGATRKPHGRDVPVFNVAKPQRVLYLEQEIGSYDMKQRLSPMYSALPPEHQALMAENLAIYSCDSEMQLDSDKGNEIITQLIEQHRPNVVCFDPLIEFHTKEENSTREMAYVFRRLDRLRQRHNFASIITHHNKKPKEDGFTDNDPNQLRGNSVIFGKGDSYLMLKVANRNAGVVEVEFTVRRGRPIDSLCVMLNWQSLQAAFHCWGKYKGVKGKRVDESITYQ